MYIEVKSKNTRTMKDNKVCIAYKLWVSYQKEFGEEGTVYRQTLRIKTNLATWYIINEWLKNYASKIKYGETIKGHVMIPENIKPIEIGKNYLKITEFVALDVLLGLSEKKRVKTDRNTILIAELPCKRRKNK